MIHICYAIYAIYLYCKNKKNGEKNEESYVSHHSEFEKPIELEAAQSQKSSLMKDRRETQRKGEDEDEMDKVQQPNRLSNQARKSVGEQDAPEDEEKSLNKKVSEKKAPEEIKAE